MSDKELIEKIKDITTEPIAECHIIMQEYSDGIIYFGSGGKLTKGMIEKLEELIKDPSKFKH